MKMHRIKRWGPALVLALGLCLWGWLFLSVQGKTDLVSPAPTVLLEDRHGTFLAEQGRGDVGFWPVSGEGAARLAACVIAAEDHRFHQHGGVDLYALGRALNNNLRGRPRQGASTIAMQVARLQSPADRTYSAKMREMAVAWMLVRRHGREAVLHHYLRIAPQGNRMFGVAYAARRYFRKPVTDLGWAESALLAALPKAPGSMNLYRFQGRKKAMARARHILALLHQRQILDDAGRQRALEELENLPAPVREARPANAYHAILQLEQAAADRLVQGRPMRTSLDLNVQDLLDEIAAETVTRYRGRGMGNLAMLVVHRQSGEIHGYLGSEWYGDTANAGSIDYVRTPRSSGSTLKPFLFAMGLERGHYTPASILADLPMQVDYEGGTFNVTNFDEGYLGPMLYRRALANSRNIPSIEVLRRVGARTFYQRLVRLGLANRDTAAEHYGLALAIGGLPVRLDDLVRAYGVLANEGRDFQLRWFPGQLPQQGEQIFPEDTARQISLFLSDPGARLPSFPRSGNLEFPFPVAAKTGTSQGFRDAWCVAYSSEYVVGAWLGHPDVHSMERISGMHAAGLVKQVLTRLQPQQSRGIDEKPFPPPRDHHTVRLCRFSGGLAVDACAAPALEYLPADALPPARTDVHQQFAVDRQTGYRADIHTPPERVEIREFAVLPAEFAAWGNQHGFGPPQARRQAVPKTHIAIQSPGSGRLRLDPDTPRKLQTLALRAAVEPAVPEIVWYVNGQPFQRAAYPYTVRWPLAPGKHTFQARFPNAGVASQPVSLEVSP